MPGMHGTATATTAQGVFRQFFKGNRKALESNRIIDGRDAVRFLVALKETLEDPARLLLEI